MKKWTWLLLIIALCIGMAAAQDPVKVAANHYKVLYENASIRVVQNTLAPGEKDAMHTHPAGWFYVTQPGTLKVSYSDGKVTNEELKPGAQEWSDAEGPHTSENVGKTTLQWVEVELKHPAKAAAKPTAKPAVATKPEKK